PAHSRDTCIDRVALATGEPTTIGEDITVAVGLVKADVVPAKSCFVHQAGIGSPDPVADDAPRGYRNRYREVLIHLRVIFSNAVIAAIPEHAVDHVMAVDAVVDFPDTVVAD